MRAIDDIIKEIRDLLDEKRSSGMPFGAELAFGPGISVSLATGDLISERSGSETAKRLNELMDELMAQALVTEPCREHLKERANVGFNMGLSTEHIIDFLACSEGSESAIFQKVGLAEYEKSLLVIGASAFGGYTVAMEVMPKFRQWALTWKQVYGEDEEVEQVVEFADAVLREEQAG